MREFAVFFLIGIVVLASGCIGEKVGLTEEKVLTALESIETAKYQRNFSISIHFTDPDTNRTINIEMSGNVSGMFNKTAELEAGNMSLSSHMMGMDINMNWPYLINGTEVYFKVDGEWYLVPPNDNLHSQAQGSLNVEYIRNLLKMKNVTIKKLAGGYAFRVNVTFWEFVKATNQTGYFNELWSVNGENRVNVTTTSGWVEVHLTEDGIPTFIETYMDLILTIKGYNGTTVDVHMTIHYSVALSHINEPVRIEVPEGVKSAGNFKEIFW